ncbi:MULTISPECIES: 4-hydroxy-tetrahydrodipicolinate synthase [Geobacillus]|uniref:4-hydroxy-tetrahydrodipicolinate synthase n=1 Tax=Geobacillus TaxID=129337 RepID=UPI0003587FB9|nr:MULTISPECIES: 4-hydroxy-tetrahydrodipicolinate synthase [Geobacillus]EPR29390.1 Dihydrodipicolinate synthase [Geobacillus sp. WSUCF1]OQP23992.1 dihydrodipicolinate synthase family protein [Geobacillus zalihae]RXS85876.1 4-hydroxy-tetrahydrodipicolinate synthase [Geobacillus sp. PK12]
MYKPFGMIPALPTPMKEDNSIDYNGLEQLIEHLISGGMNCLLVGGSTGEYSLMTMEERKEVIKFVCEKSNGRLPVMAGTGCHRTEDTIELTQYAAEVGADCALVITPYYMKTSKKGIIDHYKAVAENSSIGIVIYHYPDATGVELEPELIYELSQIDGIVGIKNTADGIHTSKLIALVKDNPNFKVLTGFEHLILPTLALGGHGAVGVVHNLVPKKLAKLYDLIVNKNNLKEAMKLNQELLELYDAIEEEPIPGTVKAGLEVLGLSGGPSRLPLVPASEKFKLKIGTILDKLGELRFERN